MWLLPPSIIIAGLLIGLKKSVCCSDSGRKQKTPLFRDGVLKNKKIVSQLLS